MRRKTFFTVFILFAAAAVVSAQEETAPKRGFLGRMLHPFSSSKRVPEYRDPKLRGLLLSIQLPAEPVKLSEVRQLPLTVSLTNRGTRAVELSFPTEQRIEILLHDAAGRVVTRWSDNHAFEPNPATVLVNPDEHLEYSETIATRDLAPNKVFTVEVLMPAYPELDVKRKSLTAP